MSKEPDEFDPLKEAQLDAFLDAFVTAKMELSRRILAISSAGMGLVVTITLSLSEADIYTKSSLTLALLSFCAAVGCTIRSLQIDPDYIAKTVDEIHNSEKSDELLELSERTGNWGTAGQFAFATGVAILLLVSIFTIWRLESPFP